jgi:hypothetical protein
MLRLMWDRDMRAVADALHMATAVRHGIDYLLTWNCKHIANAELRRRIDSLRRKSLISIENYQISVGLSALAKLSGMENASLPGITSISKMKTESDCQLFLRRE